ncbi:MAG TPA: cell division protein FtsZ, partial [Tetrasphaera sp.]|nr:cell division protein FtsZ [Tetrasphaera sp.]
EGRVLRRAGQRPGVKGGAPSEGAAPAAAAEGAPRVEPARPPKQVVFDDADDLDVPEWLK